MILLNDSGYMHPACGFRICIFSYPAVMVRMRAVDHTVSSKGLNSPSGNFQEINIIVLTECPEVTCKTENASFLLSINE